MGFVAKKRKSERLQVKGRGRMLRERRGVFSLRALLQLLARTHRPRKTAASTQSSINVSV